jgi:sn-1 stearoyl-lipid 9-desaturase
MSTSGILWTTTVFVFWFLLSYYWHGVGITLGYHRLLTHRSLRLPTWLAYFWVAGGYLSLMGSPLVWVGVHRLHHQKSDVEGDPHSPVHGFKHALYEWMFDMNSVQSDTELQAQVPELMKDPIYRFLGIDHSARQAQLCLTFNIIFRVILYLVAGPIAVIANLIATVMVFWSTQLVNAVCHVDGMGYRSHETREFSRNVWWVGLLAVGEGWHNNHHAFPKSAQHGMQWFEVDVTWYTIWVLEKLGLAKNVIRPSVTVRRAHKTAMQEFSASAEPAVERALMELANIQEKMLDLHHPCPTSDAQQ